jgi:hypothetical protein
MRKAFRVSDFVLRVEDAAGELFPLIADRFALEEAADGSTPDAVFRLVRRGERLEPPAGAVRTRVTREGREVEFRLDRLIFDRRGDDYHALRDFDSMRAEVFYPRATAENARHAATALKWQFIKTAERCGHAYLHAAAVRYRGRNIVFAGHSGSGKSSCLVRLMDDGGQVITDDTLLVKDGRLVPFDFFPSHKGDWITRFSSGSGRLDPRRLGEILAARYSGIDVIVFPHVWFREDSATKDVPLDEALDHLRRIYLKEEEWNAFPEPIEEVLAAYRALLEGAPRLAFYAGRDETMVVRELLQRLGGDAG